MSLVICFQVGCFSKVTRFSGHLRWCRGCGDCFRGGRPGRGVHPPGPAGGVRHRWGGAHHHGDWARPGHQEAPQGLRAGAQGHRHD